MTKPTSMGTAVRRERPRLMEKRKQRWRDQVVFDCRLSGMTKAVAYAMASWVTARDTELLPHTGGMIVRGTQRALAEMVGCSAKTVHLAMVSLIEHGHVELLRRPQGRDDTNLYCIIPFPDSDDVRGARAAAARAPVMQALS
jgi:hypothetical protein